MKTSIETRPRTAFACLLLGLAAAACGSAADLHVPAGYPTIQAAVDAASEGDAIHIAAGVYAGQVLISNKSLTLLGSPGAVLRATSSMSQPYTALGTQHVPLLGILRSDVVVSNLTFEGARLADCQASDFDGIYYLGSGGRVEDCRITGFRGDSLGSGVGNGLRVVNHVSLGTSAVSIQVLRSTFADNSYSIVLAGDFLSAIQSTFDPALIRTTFVVSDNTITGNGPDATGVQDGIQILTGATGEVSRNTISDHAYTGTTDPTPYSVGVVAFDQIHFFGAQPLAALHPIRFEGNVFRNNQFHLTVMRGDGSTIFDNTFDGMAPGRRPMGLGLSGENLLVGGNRFSNLPQGIVLFGNDPDFGTNLGIAHNAGLSGNRFCNVTNTVTIQPLATATERDTLTCPFPVELTSIIPTTNGVSVAWTDPGPGQAYTVQVRESFTNGAWRDATTRYRWPWPHTRWGDAPDGLPAARFYRVLTPQATATPNRGNLLRLKRINIRDFACRHFSHHAPTCNNTQKFCQEFSGNHASRVARHTVGLPFPSK
jgi:nitrous oxidase accessory protein NosD